MTKTTIVEPSISKRVLALAEELDLAINPLTLAEAVAPQPSSIKNLIDQLVRVVMLLPSVDTSRSSLTTKLFILALYQKPPSLALVHAKIRRGVGRATILTTNERIELVFDDLAFLLGPQVSRKKAELEQTVKGDYIPVSAKYMVTPHPVGGATPEYKVEGKRTWYIYKASRNPVPCNITILLTLK